MSVASLVSTLRAAADAYHNGREPIMSDDAFDAAMDELRARDPDNPFLSQVGSRLPGELRCQEVDLPIPLPSLNKLKTPDELAKWAASNGSTDYHISVKLDGCSALWFPRERRLFTRGDGMRGRDISAFAPFIRGLATTATAVTTANTAVRGELIIQTDSPAVPPGKLARNIVAGALNRPLPEPTQLAEIRFVAYELMDNRFTPTVAFQQMQRMGFEVANSSIFKDLSPESLTRALDTMEEHSPYQIDGIVIAPESLRPPTWLPEVRNGAAINPTDRFAWKTRSVARVAQTTVREVVWNISRTGFLIPTVHFEPVELSGAVIGAANGLHGRWIYDMNVGPGAIITVRRSGDVIPQILNIVTPAPEGPAMPALYKWADADGASVSSIGSSDSHASQPTPSTSSVHIKPLGAEYEEALICRRLTHGLKELGAENVGPGTVAKLYAGGLRDLRAIFAASIADLSRLPGIQARGATKIWTGLRAGQASWTELNLLVASNTMPRGVGHSKLTPLLRIEPHVERWPRVLHGHAPSGLSLTTVHAIMAAVPAFLAWKEATGLFALHPLTPPPPPPPEHLHPTTYFPMMTSTVPTVPPTQPMTVVFTGVRDKELEARLISRGHTVAATVTKKTTHVVHADGAETSTTKIQKARETGAVIMSISDMRAMV